MPRYFLGVDGGQSTTTALVADETGRVVGGPCNHVGAAEGRAKMSNAVRECVGRACAAAAWGLTQLAEDREFRLYRID
jgi:N-acetylglucosamine kinase-like BadF-type ATPase